MELSSVTVSYSLELSLVVSSSDSPCAANGNSAHRLGGLPPHLLARAAQECHQGGGLLRDDGEVLDVAASGGSCRVNGKLSEAEFNMIQDMLMIRLVKLLEG
ncbi:hypothetical protein E2562_019045 [Oryza meyeriana var. granulata]|uniref:Uncharacterized protein n=1 Tax=Oryza meyeriana var. granulata TaxID=110450 RepID=A0A6G1EMY2_9ORYZ|nr:hypothetical protein E2562_019045 [Oryza meyeriana var. granulata]